MARVIFVLSHDNSVVKLRQSAVNKFGSVVRRRGGTRNRTLVSAILFSGIDRILRSHMGMGSVQPVASHSCAIHKYATLLSTVNNTVRRVKGIRGCTEPRSIPRRAVFMVAASKVRGTDHQCGDRGIGRVVRQRGTGCN